MTVMTTRREQAESVTSHRSVPTCPQCGRPVVRTHRCPATQVTSILHGPPPGWRDQVEADRAEALHPDPQWDELALPLDTDAPD